MNYRSLVRCYPDFPKEGVLFWDFSYLLKDVHARNTANQEIKEFLRDKKIDAIAAIESKGFTLGAILAHELQVPMVLIRKPNLVPGEVYSQEFVKEYGTGEYVIKADAVLPKERIVVVYDIMAGSGASKAAISLIEKSGGVVAGLAYVTELEYLGGREELAGYDILSLVRIRKKYDTVD